MRSSAGPVTYRYEIFWTQLIRYTTHISCVTSRQNALDADAVGPAAITNPALQLSPSLVDSHATHCSLPVGSSAAIGCGTRGELVELCQ